jgi:hypothetical protein
MTDDRRFTVIQGQDDPLERFVAHETAKMDLQDCIHELEKLDRTLIGLHWAQIEGKIDVQIPTEQIPRHRATLSDAIQRLKRLAGE